MALTFGTNSATPFTMTGIGIPSKRKKVNWQTKTKMIRTTFRAGTCLNAIITIQVDGNDLKMETVYFSETLVSTVKSTRRYDPGYQYQYLHRSENLKSQIMA
jgi:hypothetical protein